MRGVRGVHELAVGYLDRYRAGRCGHVGESMGGGKEVACAARVDDDGRGGTWRSLALFVCVEALGATCRCARRPADLFLLRCCSGFTVVSGVALSFAGAVGGLVDALVLLRGEKASASAVLFPIIHGGGSHVVLGGVGAFIAAVVAKSV